MSAQSAILHINFSDIRKLLEDLSDRAFSLEVDKIKLQFEINRLKSLIELYKDLEVIKKGDDQ